MLFRIAFFSLLLGVCCCTRPRGVRPEAGVLYNPASDFSCLDGSNTIPFIQVNDDYCDCDDGSDEPGTSACPEGKFYCENKGHNPLVIPSSRVNDGICDCCDGSDEWDSSSTCQDTCMELGRAAREAAEARAKVAMEGFNIKQGMIKEGQNLQDERVGQVAEKEAEKAKLEAEKEAARLAKEEAEKPEKEALDFYRQLEEEEKAKKEEEVRMKTDTDADELFNKLDTNQDNLITVDELQARPGLDTNKDGTVSLDEANFFLGGIEQFDRQSFRDVGYTLIKPYIDLGPSSWTPPESTPSPDSGEIPTPPSDEMAPPTPAAAGDPEVYDPWRANQAKQEEMIDDAGDYEDEDEESEEKEEEDYDIADTQKDDTESAPEAKIEEKYDDRTRGLIAAADEARKNFNDIERKLRDLDRDIKNIKDVMEKDYGAENEYAVLSGQCFEYTDNEYVYTMCPFDKCTQRSKNGGADTRLGGWGEWKGPADNQYSVMKYTGGQQCWNGPARSAMVYLHCGTDNKVSAVSEPNRCEYEMHFYTPAACSKPSLSHDEL